MTKDELEPIAEKAAYMLREDAAKHAQDKANADYLESWVKVVKAQLKNNFEGSNAAAEDYAIAHPAFLEALQAKKQADAIHYTNQFKREAADAHIRIWQTLCSNERANV